MRKKILKFVLCFVFLLSITLNLYFLIPKIPKQSSHSISTGYYVSCDADGVPYYKFSVMQDNTVVFYNDKDQLLLKGTLEFDQKDNYYLMKFGSQVYQIAANDNIISFPIVEKDRIISALFTKISDVPVTYGKK